MPDLLMRQAMTLQPQHFHLALDVRVGMMIPIVINRFQVFCRKAEVDALSKVGARQGVTESEKAVYPKRCRKLSWKGNKPPGVSVKNPDSYPTKGLRGVSAAV